MEHGDEIIFLHSVKEGPSSQSYGLQVARLAGIPGEVIANARQNMSCIETGETRPTSRTRDLFQPGCSLSDKLKDVDPDELTPKQALELIYSFKKNLD